MKCSELAPTSTTVHQASGLRGDKTQTSLHFLSLEFMIRMQSKIRWYSLPPAAAFSPEHETPCSWRRCRSPPSSLSPEGICSALIWAAKPSSDEHQFQVAPSEPGSSRNIYPENVQNTVQSLASTVFLWDQFSSCESTASSIQGLLESDAV